MFCPEIRIFCPEIRILIIRFVLGLGWWHNAILDPMEIKIVNNGFDQLPEQIKEILTLVKELSISSNSNISKPNENELMSRQATADYFGVDISTIHNWTKKGKLKAYCIGNEVYYRQSEFFPQKQN